MNLCLKSKKKGAKSEENLGGIGLVSSVSPKSISLFLIRELAANPVPEDKFSWNG